MMVILIACVKTRQTNETVKTVRQIMKSPVIANSNVSQLMQNTYLPYIPPPQIAGGVKNIANNHSYLSVHASTRLCDWRIPPAPRATWYSRLAFRQHRATSHLLTVQPLS